MNWNSAREAIAVGLGTGVSLGTMVIIIFVVMFTLATLADKYKCHQFSLLKQLPTTHVLYDSCYIKEGGEWLRWGEYYDD